MRETPVTDNLRDRIREEVLDGILSMFSENDSVEMAAGYIADAVIRELDTALTAFGSWLSEEITGQPLSRIDVDSCVAEWKWLNDESRWIKGEPND